MIETKELKLHLDDRGYLFEMMRDTDMDDEIRQITVSTIFPGVIKAFHKHEKQTDWVCCSQGNVMLIVFGAGLGLAKPQKVFLGEKNPLLVKIPPNIFHGYKALGNESATIIYATNKTYDPTDELRKPWDILGKEVWEVQNK